jgi:hypothetical protein
MSQFGAHKWWLLTLLLTVPLLAVAAVPNVFKANTVLKASDLNDNFTDLDARLAKLEANANAGSGCYTHWGVNGCVEGYSPVIKGHPGGVQSYATAPGAGYGNLECVSDEAAVQKPYRTGNYATRLLRPTAEGTRYSVTPGNCSICCRSGCYTALGISSCAEGYTRAYKGRAGGSELFLTTQYPGGKPYGKTVCVDDEATALYTTPEGSAAIELFRHFPPNGADSGGMEQVENSCAVCCR